MIHRRAMLLGTAAVSNAILPRSAFSQAVASDKLRVDPAQGDRVIGKLDAPITIIEYASLTCHHCYNFHVRTWPTLKSKYVDTGKVRFVIRDFPLDPRATAGFMLARCIGEDKWYPMMDVLFTTQESWSHAKDPVEALAQTVRQAGMTRERFDACLKNEAIYRTVTSSVERGKELGVNSTPTFFINGRKEVGALSIEQFDKILEPLIAAKSQ